jgi:lipopolysaccharide/colanic/teichoic acid biosynthesis glycosyltransferase
VALLIKLDTPGPVFFRQWRIGRDGKSFPIMKFRTMVADAEDHKAELMGMSQPDRPLFKIEHDPRITRVGSWLRRTSLDELPQLINVVRGQMSLVGPRPHLIEELAQFGPDSSRRLLVKPGMTGIWQVNGRSDLPHDEAMRLDLSYVDNWSLGLDASIILRTLAVMVDKSGAY